MDIKDFIKENRENIIKDIARVVSKEDAVDALHETLSVATDLGLGVHNCEDIVGYAYIGSDSDSYLATITHVDIVPPGDGWDSDPFTLTEKDGFIIGRGVMDDKGPGVLCLYALKYLNDYVDVKIPARALFGTDEEVGMTDVTYYLENNPAPIFLFTPDSSFPLVNGEKGIYQGKITATVPVDRIESISGGFAPNAIPSKAYAVVDGTSFEADGIQAHASTPECGKNAIGVLLSDILDSGLAKGEEKDLLEKLILLDKAWDGEYLDIKCSDDKFDKLTCVGGVIGIEDGKIVRSIDIRFPTVITSEELTERLNRAFSPYATVEMVMCKEPFYMDPEGKEVKACTDAYDEVMGRHENPMCIGGGTYARKFPYAVSFGPETETEFPPFVGSIHGCNEGASIEELMTALEIYIKAFINLEK